MNFPHIDSPAQREADAWHVLSAYSNTSGLGESPGPMYFMRVYYN